ncbi:hypothetical protein V6R21_21385 [Limibacter armeniacum]|uniref:hypothetical protein n=1 Tax=Limibacter armeniacum TaxID=466084 RepID=UPI002FE5342D
MMKQELSSNEFLKDFYVPAYNMVEAYWQKTSNTLTDELFKESLKMYLNDIRKVKPSCVYVRTIDFFFTVSPELQSWVDNEIIAKMVQVGVKKAAFSVSSELVIQLSVEQIFDEPIASMNLLTHFFPTEEEAKRWLLKKDIGVQKEI